MCYVESESLEQRGVVMTEYRHLLRAAVSALALAGLLASGQTLAAKGKDKNEKTAEKTMDKGKVKEPAGNANVVARVGDAEITLEQVDEKARASSMDVYQTLYVARRSALDELIADTLLDNEARTSGVTKDQLVAGEITQKTAEVTDTEIDAFYTENQARMGGRTLDQMKDQIRDFLHARNADQARQQYINRLKEKAAVRVSLEPPRVTVTVADNDPAKGPAAAPVEIVTFSEFQ